MGENESGVPLGFLMVYKGDKFIGTIPNEKISEVTIPVKCVFWSEKRPIRHRMKKRAEKLGERRFSCDVKLKML
jgi:hypothetical protein